MRWPQFGLWGRPKGFRVLWRLHPSGDVIGTETIAAPLLRGGKLSLCLPLVEAAAPERGELVCEVYGPVTLTREEEERARQGVRFLSRPQEPDVLREGS